MIDTPKKGSPQEALDWWTSAAPSLNDSLTSLLTDIYNFQRTGNEPMVTRSVILEDGRILRLYGSLG